MADWNYKIEEDDDDEEQEEGAESGGDFRYSGRDSLIFLVDASKAMFEGFQDGLSPFEMTLQCIRSVYTSKIISSYQDLLGLVFFATDKHKNSVDFKHVYVLHDLGTPGAKRVLELDGFFGDKGKAHFRNTIGHSTDFSLGEALWVCSNLFSDVKLKMSHKRVMIFTNQDQPHAYDPTKAKAARTKASDLQETDSLLDSTLPAAKQKEETMILMEGSPIYAGVFLDLMHLKKAGGFDISLFYRDIISMEEDGQDLGVQFEASDRLDDLLKKVRAKETRKRALSRLSLKLDGDLALSVGVYNLLQKAVKPPPVKLYRETNEPVKTKTQTVNQKTGEILLPSDTKKAQTYGNRQIVMEKEETEELKKFDDPSLVLIGFKPLSLLKKHHFVKPAQFIYPEESLISGSTTLFIALLTKCLEKKVMMLCRYTPRRNTPPRFVVLIPQEEELDDQNMQISPSGFHLTFLPYADDLRKLDVPEKVPANQEQVEKMKEIVQKLRFVYRSEGFENPALQQHFRNLEALALDLQEPEPFEDLTLPKTDMMDRRMGPLAEEFKDLVFPPDYNPEGTTIKRKQGDGSGQAEKKAKTEVVLSEAELRGHVQFGTLGKLTVPVLKDACRLYGLKGGKKQELLDVLIDYFKKH